MRVPAFVLNQGQTLATPPMPAHSGPYYYGSSDGWRAGAAVIVAIIAALALIVVVGTIASSTRWGECHNDCVTLWTQEQLLESRRIDASVTRNQQTQIAFVEATKAQAAAAAAQAQAAMAMKTGPMQITTIMPPAQPNVVMVQPAAQSQCCNAHFGPIGVPTQQRVIVQRPVFQQHAQVLDPTWLGGCPDPRRGCQGYHRGMRGF